MLAPVEPTPYSSAGSQARAGEGTGGATNTPAQTGAVTPSNPAPPPAAAATDWTSDPIYQLVVGQQNLAIKQAQSAALTAQTQALIAYGDPTLALAVTGDQNVAAAAAANKGSTLAQLVASNAQTVRGTNEMENQSNLFFSSDRGYKLGLDQQMYLNNSSQALSSLQGNLGNITANLLAQEQTAYQAEQQAASDAYNRAIANPVGSPPTTTTTATKTVPATTAGGAVPPVAKSTPAPKTATAPYTTPITANPTGGSANKTQGVFSVH